MATFRKRKGRWDVQIRKTEYPAISKSFSRKSDAHLWALETERQIETGRYTPSQIKHVDTLCALLAQYGGVISIKKRGYKEEIARLAKMQARGDVRIHLCLMPLSIASMDCPV